jgi:diacylglycerol kinase family enzyme
MRINAVINRRSGAAIGLTLERLTEEMQAAFQKAGHEIAIDLVEPADIEASLDAAVASNPDVVLAGGGDGTVRSAAQKLPGPHIALGILPLGTINRMAHDLRIPINPLLALDALAYGTFRKIDVADVNGRIFLCNSLLGLPPKISAERQRLRGKPLSVRLPGYFKLLRAIIAARHRIRLTIDDGNRHLQVRALSLAVSNNVYRHQPSLIFSRLSLDGGVLGIYISKNRSGFGLLWVLLRAALGLWEGDPNLDHITAKRITINSNRKRLHLSEDGEVEILETPLRYQIHPKALMVLVPKATPS